MEPFIAEIKLFAGNFAPRGWAFCDGQLLPINSYQALFSLVGTIYGGDGRTTFALPDLRGRVPIGPRTGAGLSTYREGQRVGAQENYLNTNQLPAHSHTVVSKVSSGNATLSTATAGASIATPGTGSARSFTPTAGFNTSTPNVNLNSGSLVVGNTGNNLPVNNMQPALAVNYIIALQGVFPSRS